MPRIAISYRRTDSPGTTLRIVEQLVAQLGKDNVFVDIDSIPLSVDFRGHIRETIARSDVVLAIIGPHWLNKKNRKRLEDPGDFVRVEMETALELGIPLIPVLVDYARMPPAGTLPASLRQVIYSNAAEVDPARDFHVHVERLMRSIDDLLTRKPGQATAGASPPLNKAPETRTLFARAIRPLRARLWMTIAGLAVVFLGAFGGPLVYRLLTSPPGPVAQQPGGSTVSGTYVVQVFSYLRERDAQEAARDLEAKYPTVLGGRINVRSGDSPGKGTVYRGQIGPFATLGEAEAFCDGLKAAGAQCIVPK